MYKNWIFMPLCRRRREFKWQLGFCLLMLLYLIILLLFVGKKNRTMKLAFLFDRNTAPDVIRLKTKDISLEVQLKRVVKQFQRQEQSMKNAMYRKKAKHFNSPLEVDTSEDEKKCPRLYEIAREMLDGLKIKLPSETNNTRWKFRKRVDLNKLKTTKLRWNAPWEQGNSPRTKEHFKRYNVSATSIKNRKIFITYGHNCCRVSKVRAVESAMTKAKMDHAEALDLSALSVPFQISHSKRLRKRKGAGYWLWKSYIILKTMLYKLNDGDVLLYHDSGMYFANDAGPLLKLCQDVKPSVLTFTSNYEEAKYSKRDAFVLMDMDDPVVYDKSQKQRIGNIIVAVKNCESLQFVMELLAYTMDDRITDDRPNVMGKPNFPNFFGNRHDQTVLSLLSKKWGILEVRDPCTCGRNGFGRNYGYASGPYTQLYVHDRNRS